MRRVAVALCAALYALPVLAAEAPLKILTPGYGQLAMQALEPLIEKTIGGPVEISDGSGEIDIREVGRDVVISSDGSGGIDIRGVKGNVTVDSDGSGEIDVRDVTGDFIVHNDGSGGINYVSVGGKIRLPRDDR